MGIQVMSMSMSGRGQAPEGQGGHSQGLLLLLYPRNKGKRGRKRSERNDSQLELLEHAVVDGIDGIRPMYDLGCWQ